MADLPPEAFAKLMERFDPEPNRAGELYNQLHLKLTKFFEWKNCAIPEELADEALNRVANKLHQGEDIQNINAYANRVARFILLEVWRKPSAPEVPPENPEAPSPNPHMDCLEECLETLTGDDRGLILEFYEGEGRERINKRKEMTKSLGITVNALKLRAFHVRRRLEKCINVCVERAG